MIQIVLPLMVFPYATLSDFHQVRNDKAWHEHSRSSPSVSIAASLSPSAAHVQDLQPSSRLAQNTGLLLASPPATELESRNMLWEMPKGPGREEAALNFPLPLGSEQIGPSPPAVNDLGRTLEINGLTQHTGKFTSISWRTLDLFLRLRN